MTTETDRAGGHSDMAGIVMVLSFLVLFVAIIGHSLHRWFFGGPRYFSDLHGWLLLGVALTLFASFLAFIGGSND